MYLKAHIARNNDRTQVSSQVDTFIVIRSQADYDAAINCPISGLDFTDFDLIIGQEAVVMGVDYLDYAYNLTCNPDGSHLDVTIIHDDTDWAGVITYHAIVPKMVDEDALVVELGLVMP